MEIILDEKVKVFLKNLPVKDREKVSWILNGIKEKDSKVYSKWIKNIKKITDELWELKVQQYRFLYSVKGDIWKIWHGFVKKSMKIPKKEIQIAENRMKKKEV